MFILCHFCFIHFHSLWFSPNHDQLKICRTMNYCGIWFKCFSMPFFQMFSCSSSHIPSKRFFWLFVLFMFVKEGIWGCVWQHEKKWQGWKEGKCLCGSRIKKQKGRKKKMEIMWGHGRTSKAKKGKRECVYVWEER